LFSFVVQDDYYLFLKNKSVYSAFAKERKQIRTGIDAYNTNLFSYKNIFLLFLTFIFVISFFFLFFFFVVLGTRQ